MEKKKLKQAEIKNGKICLEGKVVDAEILGLSIIREDAVTIDDERGKFKDVNYERVPKGTNAQVLGKLTKIWAAHQGPELEKDYYPILYLKIKELTPYAQKNIEGFYDNLSARARNLLGRCNVKTPADLSKFTKDEMLSAYKNAGKVTVNELRQKILLPAGLDYQK